jgi:hexosaminidase
MDGKTFEQLREVDLTEASHTQGRNKVVTSIQFPAREVISLKVKAQSLDPIPKGHHRAGQSSRMYLDEIVVL